MLHKRKSNISGNKYLLLKLFSYLKPYKKQIVLILLCVIFSACLSLAQPLLIQGLMDDGLVKKNISTIIRYSLLILALVVADQGMNIVETRFHSVITSKYSYDIFHDAFRKLLHFRLDYFGKKNFAEITNNLSMDVGNVSRITDKGVLIIIGQLFKMISGIAGLLLVSWRLTLLVVAIAFSKYFVVRFLTKQRKKGIQEMLNANRDFYSWFGEIIGGIREIKLWSLHRKTQGAFVKKQRRLLLNNVNLSMIDCYNQSFEILLYQLITCLLYILGGYLIIGNSLTVGGLFAFISYTTYVTMPISTLLNLGYSYVNVFPSAKRLFEFMDSPSEEVGLISAKASSRQRDAIQGKITFENVTFSYREGEPILRDVSFEILPGEKVAIVGANGAGKTTLINLLLRFYKPDSGDVYLDNENIQHIKLNDYRASFSVVSQEPFLFNASVRENIDLRGGMDAKGLDTAIQRSGAEGFIDRLPQGIDTIVGRNGSSISGGERQKISVARALAGNSSIVIFDEATSSYDAFSDESLNSIIVDELSDKTVLIITHKQQIIKYVDKVLTIHNKGITVDVCSKTWSGQSL